MTEGFGTITVPLRLQQARMLVAEIMRIVSPSICGHTDENLHRKVSRELFEAFYNAGVEIITDQDRRDAGLRPRGEAGLTPEKLLILENNRMLAMLQPLSLILEKGKIA